MKQYLCAIGLFSLLMVSLMFVMLILDKQAENSYRVMFVKGCAKERWQEDVVIKFCNEQYIIYKELQDRNWK